MTFPQRIECGEPATGWSWAALSLLTAAGVGLFLLSVGCETKSAARTKASLAYIQGRRAGENAVAKAQDQKLEVIVHGEVANNHIPWSRDLTVSRAIVAAGYKGVMDPGAIDVIHNGVSTRILPRQLLRGEDIELDPGDVVEIRPFSQVH